MKIEVSNGELIDKLTILEIKSLRISDSTKSKNILKELEIVKESAQEILQFCLEEYKKLKEVNNSLWDIEDRIRSYEYLNDFGEDFIDTARSVYKLNDVRAAIKKEINILTNSGLSEEKSYDHY